MLEIKDIREQANKLATDMRALIEAARGDDRDLTTEERQQFDTMDADREALLADERRLLKADELSESRGRQVSPRAPVADPRESRRHNSDDTEITNLQRAEVLRAWFLSPSPEFVRTAEVSDIASRMGVNIDQKFLRLRLAPKALRSLRSEDVRQWEERALGSSVVSPDDTGHYTVPNETMRALEEALLAYGGLRQLATVIRTQSGASLPIPTTNDTSNEGAILAENTQESTETDPAFSQLVLESYKYSSRKILVSIEFLQDNAINAAEVIGRMLGERIGRITHRHFTVGTGNGQPNGVVTAATTSAVTTAAATAITRDELIDLKHSVDPAYRDMGARFMFNDTTLKLLKKIKVPQYSGDTAGIPLWQAGMTVGQPDTIDGDPYTINQHMAAPTAGLKSVAYGLFSKYLIRDVMNVMLMRLDELYAEYGQVAFLAFSRHDGDLLDAGTHPVKYLTMHA